MASATNVAAAAITRLAGGHGEHRTVDDGVDVVSGATPALLPGSGRGEPDQRAALTVGDGLAGRDALTVGEVALLLRVSPMTIYRLARAGTLESRRVGRSIRIPCDALVAHLRQPR